MRGLIQDLEIFFSPVLLDGRDPVSTWMFFSRDPGGTGAYHMYSAKHAFKQQNKKSGRIMLLENITRPHVVSRLFSQPAYATGSK